MAGGVAEVNMTSFSVLNQQTESRLVSLASWGAALMMFGAPTSISVFGMGALLVAIGFFSRQLRLALVEHRKDVLLLEFVSLFALMCIAAAYSVAPFDDVLDMLGRYARALLLVPLTAVVLIVSPAIKTIFRAFLVGHGLLVLLIIGNYFVDIPGAYSAGGRLFSDHSIFVDYIAETISICLFVTVVWAHANIGARRRSSKAAGVGGRILLFAGLMGSVFAVFFLMTGRGGQVIMLALLLFFCYQALVHHHPDKRKAINVTLLALTSVGVGLLISTDRMRVGIEEALTYAGFDHSPTSWGIRLGLLEIGGMAFLQSPIFGHGTGAWHVVADEFYANPAILPIARVFPNNQFIHTAVELGVIGLIVLGYLLSKFYRLVAAKRTHHPVYLAGCGLLIILLLDFVFHAAWYRSGERESFIIGIAIVLALAKRYGQSQVHAVIKQ